MEDIEELRRAVKLEVAELEKMLKELVHHHDNSLKMVRKLSNQRASFQVTAESVPANGS